MIEKHHPSFFEPVLISQGAEAVNTFAYFPYAFVFNIENIQDLLLI